VVCMVVSGATAYVSHMKRQSSNPIPVILDTDIGGDIDDTWALAMMLNSPELDVKLVVSATADTVYRAKIIAKLLDIAGRTDIPVGVGLRQGSAGHAEPQEAWVKDYDLGSYPGKVHEDGIQALIDRIMESKEPITLISIGPVPNIALALQREPRIAAKCRFVGMHGSIRRSHDGKDGAIAEYNVEHDIPACQAVFAAPWRQMVITPLDTCGLVRLRAEKYRAVCACPAPLTQAVIENYRIWLCGKPDEGTSSILFDTVAIHLAYSTEYLAMERMGIRVDDEGFTVPDPEARLVEVALDWKDLAGYEDFLVERLTRA
jgi:inosine-uridine nucleoside N-ribohydrolase